MSSPGIRGNTAVAIELGRVADVNIAQYTVDVFTEETYRRVFDVPFATPYTNMARGTGMNFMPEAGTTCYICWPSQMGSYPFVLGWFSPQDEAGGFRGARRALEAGDLILDGTDGNYVWVRRGGVIEVAATPICRRFYIPINNLIRDVCGSYRLQNLGGALDWSVETSKDKDGHQPVHFALGIKEFADHSKVMVAVDVAGAVGGDPDELLSDGGAMKTASSLSSLPGVKIRIFDTNDDFKETITYQFLREGTVKVTLAKELELTVEEKIAISSVKGDVEVTAQEGNITISTGKGKKMALNALGGNMDLTAKLISLAGEVVFSGGAVKFKNDSPVTVGDGAVGVVLEPFLNMFVAHTHGISGAVTTPPDPATYNPALAQTQALSQALKAKPGLG